MRFYSRLHAYGLWLFSAFLLFGTLPSLATPNLKDYGALPGVTLMAVSPNGDLVAYRSHSDNHDRVQVISIGQKKLLFAVDVSNIQPNGLYFFSDDKLFMRASQYKRVEGFIGKFDLSTGYVLNIKDQKIRQLLIPGDKIYAGQSGLGRVVGVTPDGKHALMPAYSLTDMHFPVPTYSLYKVNLERKSLRPIASGENFTDDYFVDAQGDALIQEQFNERTSTHKVLVRNNKKWVEIYSEVANVRTRSFVGLTPDRKALVMLMHDEAGDRFNYYTMSLGDGAINGPLFMRNDADIDGVITDRQRVIHGVIYSGFTPSYHFFDEKLNKRLQDIIAQFPEHSVRLSDWSPDWKHWLVNVSGSSYADDYFLFSEGKEPVFLASGRSSISNDQINPIGKVTYKARDGLSIPTLLTIPHNKVSAMKNLPAVILPHGGPAAYDQIGFDYLAQALANQGYLVIQPQFRGSTGFGLQHRDAGLGEWGAKMQDDLSDGLAFLTNKGIIDPKRVCIVGASYGGYAALAGGALTPELYRCVVSINGIGDLNAMLRWDKNRHGNRSEVAAYMTLQLGNGKIDPRELERRSPRYQAAAFSAPVLLIHAENDSRVPISQSEDMHKALRKANKPSELVTLKGDNHYLQDSDTRLQALQATIAFVNQHLQ